MILFTLLIAHGLWLGTPDTARYVVLNHGRTAGEMTVMRDARSVVVRFHYADRGRPTRFETRYHFTAAGALHSTEIRQLMGHGVAGVVVERFDVIGDSVRWSARSVGAARAGSAPVETAGDRQAFYRPAARTPFDNALLARFLLGTPQRTARLWPEGAARLEVVADTMVDTSAGRTRVRLAMVFADGATPYGVWLDDRDQLFADEVSWFITVRRGAEQALPALRRIEIAYRNAQAEALARRVTKPASGALVIHNGDVFDSELGVIRPRTTVIVRADRIVAVGPADSLALPQDATLIDATGKMVIPGLWDMHVHTQLRHQGSASLRHLAAGITTVRDLASDVDVAVSHRDRAAAGSLASPRLILAGFVEGPGERAGPTDAIVSTADAARTWVARYDSLKYRQIKLYGLIPPNLVTVITGEARKRGLRVSGHVTEGLSPEDVVRRGFHEINHADVFFAALLPDSLRYPPTRRSVAIAQRLVDVDGDPMTRLIEMLRTHRITVDATLNVFRPRSASRASEAAWDATFGRLVKRLHDEDVTLVAGSDGSADRYLTELALYQRAGIPAARVLQIATIVAARVMNEDALYGSIVPGKIADIVIVNGRPLDRIADLEHVETVIRAGRLYEAAELRAVLARRP
jgi:hypothetical protein